MNLHDIRTALAAAVDTIDGLTVFPFNADRISAPAALVGWPEPYTFDTTMGRGTDTAVFPVLVLVSKADAEQASVELGAYCNGSGDSSVKQAIESHDGSAVYDDATVQSVEFVTVTIAATEYLAAEFSTLITANGVV